jgi:hypothetical protein
MDGERSDSDAQPDAVTRPTGHARVAENRDLAMDDETSDSNAPPNVVTRPASSHARIAEIGAQAMDAETSDPVVAPDVVASHARIAETCALVIDDDTSDSDVPPNVVARPATSHARSAETSAQAMDGETSDPDIPPGVEDVAAQAAPPLADEELVRGGLVKVRAWMRTPQTEVGLRKARQRTRQRLAGQQQINLVVPADETTRNTLRALARGLMGGDITPEALAIFICRGPTAPSTPVDPLAKDLEDIRLTLSDGGWRAQMIRYLVRTGGHT